MSEIHVKRVLLVQENGRQLRNREFRECRALQRAFRRLGIAAGIWGRGHPNFHQRFSDVASRYDAVLSLEQYDEGWHPDLSRLELPTAFWCIDAHVDLGRYLAFVGRQRFDVVFCSSPIFVPLFARIGSRVEWLPNAFDDTLIDRLHDVPKMVLVGFCGNVRNRTTWISDLRRRWQLRHDEMVLGPDMVRAVNSYVIHWNRNISLDINYRTFETLGCGTFLLTNYTPGLGRLFTPEVHLAVYRDRDDMNGKIRAYLDRREERERIARQGYTHARRHHTYVHRARRILAAFADTGTAGHRDGAPHRRRT